MKKSRHCKACNAIFKIARKGMCENCYRKHQRKMKPKKFSICEKCRTKINRDNKKRCTDCHKDYYKEVYKPKLLEPKYKLLEAKNSARRRKHKWDISDEDYFSIISEGCKYCKSPVLGTSGGSLDRLDNKLEYTMANTVGCCKRCNQLKMDNLSPLETHIAVMAIKAHRETYRTLLIDDTRKILADRICRNYFDGIEALKSEKWKILLLDHDLASYDGDGKEKTGYDILCFLEEYPQYLPESIQIVSSNPVGRQRMQVVINKLYREV